MKLKARPPTAQEVEAVADRHRRALVALRWAPSDPHVRAECANAITRMVETGLMPTDIDAEETVRVLSLWFRQEDAA